MHDHLLAFLLILPWSAFAQTDTATVHILHGSACDVIVTLEQLSALPHHTTTIRAHDGEQADYEGALLQDVLERSCPSIGAIDKRTRARSAVRVSASDGYTALVALMEADSTLRDRPVMLCWKQDGQFLDAHNGPFQLIVPDDNRHARDVRNVYLLEVLTP